MIPHKITPQEYHQMESIFFGNKMELINGELFDMAPIGTSHFWTVKQLDRILNKHLYDQALIVCQGPLSLPNSEPEPDLMVLKLADYRQRLPKPSDVLLLIEVADSSLNYDRIRKLPLYAQHGIIEVWLIDLNSRQAEIYQQPMPNGYHKIALSNTLSPLKFPNLNILLEDILP